MPKIAIIHYKKVDYSGWDSYVEDIVPISAMDWYEVTEEELASLRTYYKAPPRRGYKLETLILEQADKVEIQTQVKNCLALAREAQDITQAAEAKKKAAAKKRKAAREANVKKRKEEQLLQLASELGKEVK